MFDIFEGHNIAFTHAHKQTASAYARCSYENRHDNETRSDNDNLFHEIIYPLNARLWMKMRVETQSDSSDKMVFSYRARARANGE